MNEINKEVFEKFANILNERLGNVCTTWQDFKNDRGDYLSEDNIRYLFYSALKSVYTSSKIILEFPFGFPDENSLEYELDSLVRTETKDNFAFELKYHRNLGSSALKRTEFAGTVFNDLIRLHNFKNRYQENTKKYFIYLTDQEMNSYFNNKKNGLSDFYNLTLASFNFDNSLRKNVKSFQKSIKVKLTGGDSCSVKKIYEKTDLPEKFTLKIWEVF